MDKMEILRMAFNAAKDPQEAMKLAREMAAFALEPTPSAGTHTLPSNLVASAIGESSRRFTMTEIAARVGVSLSTVSRAAREHKLVGQDGLIDLDAYCKLKGLSSPTQTSTHTRVTSRTRKAWTKEECEGVAALLDKGVGTKKAGCVYGRTSKAVQDAWRDGKLPTKHYKPNPKFQLGGAISAEKRGFRITERTIKTLFGGGEKE